MSPKMAEVGRFNQEAGVLLKSADKRSRLLRVSSGGNAITEGFGGGA